MQAPPKAEHSTLWALFDEYCDRLSRWEPRILAELNETVLSEAGAGVLATAIAQLCVAVCRLEVQNDPPRRLRARTLAEALSAEAKRVECALQWSPPREQTALRYLLAMIADFAQGMSVPEMASRRGRPVGAFSSPAGAAVQGAEDFYTATGNSSGLERALAKGTEATYVAEVDAYQTGQRSQGLAELMTNLAPGLRAAGIPDKDFVRAVKNRRSNKSRVRI